jgi:hypothetical protein
MSKVTVTIAGRNYTVACADGEETHVAGLGIVLNEKLQQLGGTMSALESQNLPTTCTRQRSRSLPQRRLPASRNRLPPRTSARRT